MYQVSQEYLDKLYGIGKKRRVVSAFLDSVPFNEDDIGVNSLKYTLQAVSGAEIHLGGVFLGQLWLTFTKNFAANISRGTWKGKVIDLSIGLEIAEDTFEYIPIGKFTIDEANHTAKGVEVTCYDAMRNFDKSLNITTTSGSLYSIITMACRKCNVTLGQPREEIEAMPNGNEVFTLYPENDMETWRDMISWCAATMGGYATINRYGELEIRGWHSTAVQTLGIDDRYAGGSWSDFHTYYTGLSVTNIAEQTTSYYNNIPDRGLTMNLGADPFLQYGLPEAKERTRRAILNALRNFDYVPFKVSAFADPFFDLGDVINFTSGLAGQTSKCCVMRIDFSFAKGITLQGYGKNPALFGAQSKTEKNIAGLAKQSEGMETKFEVYANAEQLDLAERMGSQYFLANQVEVCELTFATNKDSVVEVTATILLKFQILLTLNKYNAVPFIDHIKVKFQVNEEDVSDWEYIPLQFFGNPDASADLKVMYPNFKIPITHYFPLLNIKGGDVNTLKVIIDYDVSRMRYRQVSEGVYQFQNDSLTGHCYIDADKLKVTLRGQGLVIEKPWDGFIIVSDDGTPIHIGSVGIEELEDTGNLAIIVPIILDQFEEEIPPVPVGILGTEEFEDEAEVMLVRPKRNIISIRNGNLVTIDKNDNITTI